MCNCFLLSRIDICWWSENNKTYIIAYILVFPLWIYLHKHLYFLELKTCRLILLGYLNSVRAIKIEILMALLAICRPWGSSYTVSIHILDQTGLVLYENITQTYMPRAICLLSPCWPNCSYSLCHICYYVGNLYM